MRRGSKILLALLGSIALCMTSARATEGDADAVRRVLMQTFDKPDARLSVAPVVVNDDVAIAGWSQGELGGRALLRKKSGVWSIDLCAGDGLKQSGTLEKLGVSKPRADTLASELAAAESKLDPALLKRFSQFDGMFAVDAAGSHSSIDPHHRPLP